MVDLRNRISVRLKTLRYEAQRIISFELVSPDGSELPKFEPGSHIDVFLPGQGNRQYSLCNSALERNRYLIAVLLEDHGTGGSQYMHETLRPGDLMEISTPRHMFKVSPRAKKHLLIGAGIGIAPILCMSQYVRHSRMAYEIHYCARSHDEMAFESEVLALADRGQVYLHLDGGDPRKGLDLVSLLKEQESGTHLYYCGPPEFMLAANHASEHWESGTVHFEHFAPEGVIPAETEPGEDREFQIKIASSGSVFQVPAFKTIVDVLKENGFEIDTSCEDGFCGTCLTRYLEGQPDHRDIILDEDDQEEYVLICCSRARSDMLVLDL